MRNLWALFVVVGIGCGSSVNVNNELPKGTVGGLVVDAATEAPMMGATVQIPTATATFTATTNMDGFWSIPGVPVGSLITQISNMGFVTAQFTAFLNGSVGNFPVTNPVLTIGPTGLVRSDGTFAIKVVDQVGVPAKDIRVLARPQVRYIDFSNGVPGVQGAYQVEAKTGTDGVATFMGLPNYNLLGGVVNQNLFVDVAPQKIMGSEVYSFLGITQFFNMGQLPSSIPTIVLAGPRTPLAVLESNIESLRGSGFSFGTAVQGSIIGTMGPITIVFNQAVRQDTVRAQFSTEDNKITNMVTPMASVMTNVVTITPSQALPAGIRFNLLLHVDAAQIGAAGDITREFNANAPFFVAQAQGVNVAVVTSGADAPKLDPPSTVGATIFNFNEPIGLGRASNGAITCVAFYEGAQFDNDGSKIFQGEWDGVGNPASLVCASSPGPASINVTTITPIDQGSTNTGFFTRWRINYDQPANGGCVTGLGVPCTRPVAGTKVHLVFSLANNKDPNSVVRRANGQPVDDKIFFMIPN